MAPQRKSTIQAIFLHSKQQKPYQGPLRTQEPTPIGSETSLGPSMDPTGPLKQMVPDTSKDSDPSQQKSRKCVFRPFLNKQNCYLMKLSLISYLISCPYYSILLLYLVFTVIFNYISCLYNNILLSCFSMASQDTAFTVTLGVISVFRRRGASLVGQVMVMVRPVFNYKQRSRVS